MLRIAIGGLGTVGSALVEMIDAAQTGQDALEITAVSARTRGRQRPVDISRFAWFDDPVAMAADEGSDVFVELIGGEDGVAKAAVEAALRSGKHVVTANKALLARHGAALAELAESHGGALRFEAAVAGGVPVVRALRDGLAHAKVLRLTGVLNGTCNFILSRMDETGAGFDEALLEAQRLGYAEADPSFDIGGVDAAHKLVLLTALGFNALPSLEAIDLTGIESVTASDIAAAGELGLKIKLIARAARTDEGLSLRVGPTLVEETGQIARIDGSDNIVIAEALPIGTVSFSGPGAGGGATATAVAADLVTIARGATGPVFAVPASRISKDPKVSAEEDRDPYYLRLEVADQPGVLAEITNVLGQAGVSVNTIRQAPTDPVAAPDETLPVELVITTHPVARKVIRPLQKTLEALPHVSGKASIFPILTEEAF
ncbi:MAG: homoserine dehydrogenase, partial [Parvularcula sp.]|nr:homoserine dehydrogenase [Parvularcula sp.]